MCSGTEKQHVADDYAKRLHIGQVECEVSILYMYVYILVGTEIRMESTFSWHEFYKDLSHTNWYICCMLKLKLHAYVYILTYVHYVLYHYTTATYNNAYVHENVSEIINQDFVTLTNMFMM